MTYFSRYIDLGGDEQLEVSIRYRKDRGTSWYSGAQLRRGLVLGFTPVKIGTGAGYQSKTYKLGDERGRMVFLEELERKSDKKGAAVAKFVAEHFDAIGERAVAQDWGGVVAIMRDHYA